MATNTKKTAARQLGDRGEDIAAAWYRRAGYTIVQRNWSCFEGEIDIIARKGKTLAICEVKARATSRFIDPALAVSPAKQTKVRTAAFRWLEGSDASGHLRFDVALVVAGKLQMLEGAF